MRKYYLPIFIALIVCLASSCGHSDNWNKLCDVGTYINERPDSALAVIDSINVDKLSSDEEKAKYALLKTMAMDKNYIDTDDDSLINVAVRYYDGKRPSMDKFLSLYYLGRIQCNRHDYIGAMLSYKEAETILNFADSKLAVGLLYDQIGELYDRYYDYPKSLEAFKTACEYYLAAEKQTHFMYALFEQANTYLQLRDYDRSESIFDSVITIAGRQGSRSMIEDCICKLIMLNCDRGDIETAISIVKKYDSVIDYSRRSPYFQGALSYIYSKNGNRSKSDYYLNCAWEKRPMTQTDSIGLYIFSSAIAENNRDYQAAFDLFTKGVKMQDSSVRENLQQPILSVQNNYLSDKVKANLVQREYERRQNQFLAVLFVLALVILLIVMVLAITRRNLAIRTYSLQLSSLKDDLSSSSQIKDEMLQSLFKDKNKLLDELGNYFYEQSNENTIKSYLYRDISNAICKLSDSKYMNDLESSVNKYNNGAMTIFRQDMPQLSEVYIRQICYHLSGFSVNSISLFMKESAPTIYKRRERIIKMISEKGSDRCRSLIPKICK